MDTQTRTFSISLSDIACQNDTNPNKLYIYDSRAMNANKFINEYIKFLLL